MADFPSFFISIDQQFYTLMSELHPETFFPHLLVKVSAPFIAVQKNDPHFKECWTQFPFRYVSDGLFHFDKVSEKNSLAKQMGLLFFMQVLETAVKSSDNSILSDTFVFLSTADGDCCCFYFFFCPLRFHLAHLSL